VVQARNVTVGVKAIPFSIRPSRPTVFAYSVAFRQPVFRPNVHQHVCCAETKVENAGI
jgi:hypothetical protein